MLRSMLDPEGQLCCYVVTRAWDAAAYFYPGTTEGLERGQKWANGEIGWDEHRKVFRDDQTGDYVMKIHIGDYETVMEKELRRRGVKRKVEP